tara:strand:- start:342 stop:800 length:459 start_codon:yes stop_codon:yes gene_type:complete
MEKELDIEYIKRVGNCYAMCMPCSTGMSKKTEERCMAGCILFLWLFAGVGAILAFPVAVVLFVLYVVFAALTCCYCCCCCGADIFSDDNKSGLLEDICLPFAVCMPCLFSCCYSPWKIVAMAMDHGYCCFKSTDEKRVTLMAHARGHKAQDV